MTSLKPVLNKPAAIRSKSDWRSVTCVLLEGQSDTVRQGIKCSHFPLRLRFGRKEDEEGMHAANFFLLILLSAFQAHAWWSHECCKCPDLDDDDGSFFINFTGGIDEDESQETGSVILSKEKRELLDLQNDYRRRVARGKVPGQPSSSKIHDLQWSTELEASAQRHADTCQFSHDSNEARRTAKWNWVGQNIAYSSSIAQNVEMWFNEYKDYNYRSNYCSGVCGHYTQLVWANTTHVGCGVSRCNFRGFDAVYVVCNYGPGGNFIGRRPY